LFDGDWEFFVHVVQSDGDDDQDGQHEQSDIVKGRVPIKHHVVMVFFDEQVVVFFDYQILVPDDFGLLDLL
jgi:hypothetical protein